MEITALNTPFNIRKCARAASGATFRTVAIMLVLLLSAMAGHPAPFALQGPGVRTNDFRVTTFATNLSYPLGMARLADGLLISHQQSASGVVI